jgi:hypothetical protein
MHMGKHSRFQPLEQLYSCYQYVSLIPNWSMILYFIENAGTGFPRQRLLINKIIKVEAKAQIWTGSVGAQPSDQLATRAWWSCKRNKAFSCLLNSVRNLCCLLLQHGHEWYSCNVTFNFTRGVWYIDDWIQQLAVHISSLNQLILSMDGVEWKGRGLLREGGSIKLKLMILQDELAAKDNTK